MQPNALDDVRTLLNDVRRRWMTATTMRAATRVAAVALGLLLLVLAADQIIQLADGPMVVVSLVALVTGVGFAVRMFWPFRVAPSDKQVARFIEERCPDLEDRLASATDVVARAQASALGDLMLGDAAARARAVDVDRVVARADVRASVFRGSVAALAFVAVFAAGSGSVGRIARTAWLYAFPYTASLEIVPGNARIVAGEALSIRARIVGTVGAPSRTLPSVTMTDADGHTRRVDMHPRSGGFEAVIDAVAEDFTYHVTAATLESAEYEVTALFAPRVAQVDVAYQYPAFTNLAPRVEPDGGDIYAPAGTQVTVTVHMDKPVSEGGLQLASGGRLTLRRTSDRTMETTFEVAGDDTYRVAVVDEDGMSSAADVDYFIRTVVDRPPQVEIVRPVGDREITPLEEVVIEARAEDDFGLERFELVYAVVGEPARAISLLPGVRSQVANGVHTVYSEGLDVDPGDFISYYARALDTNTGSTAGEVRSDIYFLEVRPFNLEFEEALSQSTAAMDAGELGNLAEVQKEIIVATWKLDRQQPDERSAEDVSTVADAQAELTRATARMAEQILGRGRATTPETRGRPSAETQAMRRAVASMTEAEGSLRIAKTDEAIPPEMDALNQLLKAQAEIRRKQVAMQQSNEGGQRSANQAQEDLSALFDQELRRDQETNYENRSSATDGENAEPESEAQQRLAELAKRQQALTEDQETLAEEEAALEAEELRRQLERLTRDQNELREQMEDLARRLERMQQSGQSGRETQEQTGQIADQMRRAMSALRRGNVSQAAQESQQAFERLEDFQRQMAGQSPAQTGEALGALQLEAQQLAQLERQMASEMRRAGTGSEARETRYGLARQGDEIADRVDALENEMEDLAPLVSGDAGNALDAASDDLRNERVAGQTRELADRLRRTVSSDTAQQVADDVEEIAGQSDELADVLERVAGRLASAGQQNATAQRLSRELEEAQRLRASLDELARQLEQMAERGAGSPPPDAESSAATKEEQGGQTIEPGAAPQTSPEGRPVPGRQEGGHAGAGTLAELQQQLMRQLAETPGLLDELTRGRPTAERDLEQWAEHWQSGPAPGTEAFKQDLSTWQDLRDDLRVALEAYEATRSQELRNVETRDRLNVGPNDQIPGEYRRLVERYYRSLATPRGRR